MYTKFLIFLSLVILTIPINKTTVINYDAHNNKSVYFKYCGEVGLYNFSIASETGYQASVNLFYPNTVGTIDYEGAKIRILEVNPHYLKIDVLNHRGK